MNISISVIEPKQNSPLRFFGGVDFFDAFDVAAALEIGLKERFDNLLEVVLGCEFLR